MVEKKTYGELDSNRYTEQLNKHTTHLTNLTPQDLIDLGINESVTNHMQDEYNNTAIYFGQINRKYAVPCKGLNMYKLVEVSYTKNEHEKTLNLEKCGLYPKQNGYNYSISEYILPYINSKDHNLTPSDTMASNVLQRLMQASEYFLTAGRDNASAQIYNIDSILHEQVEHIKRNVVIPTAGVIQVLNVLITLWAQQASTTNPNSKNFPKRSHKFMTSDVIKLINLERGLYLMILCIELLRGLSGNTNSSNKLPDDAICSGYAKKDVARMVSTYIYMFYMHLLFIVVDINLFGLSDATSKVKYPKRDPYNVSIFSIECVPRNIDTLENLMYHSRYENETSFLTTRVNPYVPHGEEYNYTPRWMENDIPIKFPKAIPTMTTLQRMKWWLVNEILPKTKWTPFIRLLQKTTAQTREVVNTNADRLRIDGASNLVGEFNMGIQLISSIGDGKYSVPQILYNENPKLAVLGQCTIMNSTPYQSQWTPRSLYMNMVRPTYYTQWPTRYGAGVKNSNAPTYYNGPNIVKIVPDSIRHKKMLIKIKETSLWISNGYTDSTTVNLEGQRTQFNQGPMYKLRTDEDARKVMEGNKVTGIDGINAIATEGYKYLSGGARGSNAEGAYDREVGVFLHNIFNNTRDEPLDINRTKSNINAEWSDPPAVAARRVETSDTREKPYLSKYDQMDLYELMPHYMWMTPLLHDECTSILKTEEQYHIKKILSINNILTPN